MARSTSRPISPPVRLRVLSGGWLPDTATRSLPLSSMRSSVEASAASMEPAAPRARTSARAQDEDIPRSCHSFFSLLEW